MKRWLAATPNYPNYDVRRDGQTFIMVKSQETSAPLGAVVLLNWFDNHSATRR